MTAVIREILLDEVKIEFQQSGEIKSGCLIKLEGRRYEFMPILRPEDKEIIRDIAVKYNFDYISVPSCISSNDILQLQIFLRNFPTRLGICARIDTVESMHVYDLILKSVDAVVIFRQELSYELHAEKLVIAQKYMI